MSDRNEIRQSNIEIFLADSRDNVIHCPQCKNSLTILDIAQFLSCPYCNYKFSYDERVQDFIDQPLIRSWMNSNH